jgi:hypothetical protein
MAVAVKLAVAVLLIPILAFCTFGFMATFEPGPQALLFRFIYVIAFLSTLIGGSTLLLKRP